MPLYFFDTSNARDIADLTGSDCANLAALRERAIRYSCEVLTELPEHFWSGRPLVMTVSDASRLPIFTLRFLAGRPPAGRLPTAIEPGCTSAGAKRALRRSVPMARYYFHLHNGDGLTPDEEGQEFAGPAEAHAAALADIRSILASEVDSGELDLNGRVEVHDEAGAQILVVAFSEAVDVHQPRAQNL